jgi:hypothetical protein
MIKKRTDIKFSFILGLVLIALFALVYFLLVLTAYKNKGEQMAMGLVIILLIPLFIIYINMVGLPVVNLFAFMKKVKEMTRIEKFYYFSNIVFFLFAIGLFVLMLFNESLLPKFLYQ